MKETPSGVPAPMRTAIERDAVLTELVTRRKLPSRVYVTRPRLPALDRFSTSLEEIWESGWLTNHAAFHQRLEAGIASFLGVEHLSLVSSGTMGLELAFRCCGLEAGEGEVITTPFTFPATVHAIRWAGLTPVFADIDDRSLNLDPRAVEDKITPRTVAVLPVHVFGVPADVEAFADLGRRTGLKIIYDGAHAFGVGLDGRPLVSWGDLTILSFHATKLFSTVEGGALVCASRELKEQADLLRCFGIVNEEEVVCVGVNGKLSEIHAAFGLLQLEDARTEIAERGNLVRLYRDRLSKIPGIRLPVLDTRVTPNNSFFPLRIDRDSFGIGRDELWELLGRCNVYTRKYFSPLLSAQRPYANLPSARPGLLPVAEKAAREILCLPLYSILPVEIAEHIAEIVVGVHQAVSRQRVG